MQIKYNSDWLYLTIELMSCLEDTNRPTVNKEMGSIDYLIDDEKSKKLIRAIIDENNKATTVYVDTIRATIEELEEEKYDEVIILSKKITKAGHEIVTQQENLNVITPDSKHNFSLLEIVSAIQNKTRELCKIKCGKVPETREDCKGKKGRKYICDIRRISDDSTFHATMRWNEVLIEDFYNLCELKRTLSE